MADEKSEVKETRYPDGKLESRAMYVNGKRHGLWEGWSKSGQQIYKSNHVDGKQQGLDEEWHENGRPGYKANFVNGKLHGLCEALREDGRQIYKYSYVDGDQHGKQIDWARDGVVTIEYYVFNVKVTKSQFDARNAAIVVAIAEAIGSSEKALGVLVDGYATM